MLVVAKGGFSTGFVFKEVKSMSDVSARRRGDAVEVLVEVISEGYDTTTTPTGAFLAVIGNPVDGFHLIGPFDLYEEAEDACRREGSGYSSIAEVRRLKPSA